MTGRDIEGRWVGMDPWLTLDWGYTPMLYYMHGYTSVVSNPARARHLEIAPSHFPVSD